MFKFQQYNPTYHMQYHYIPQVARKDVQRGEKHCQTILYLFTPLYCRPMEPWCATKSVASRPLGHNSPRGLSL